MDVSIYVLLVQFAVSELTGQMFYVMGVITNFSRHVSRFTIIIRAGWVTQGTVEPVSGKSMSKSSKND